jgi:hypothetical protein
VKKSPGCGLAPGGRTEQAPTTKEEPVGALQPIAAKVLMKILYAARMARFDLLRAVNHLACFIAKWTVDCDRRLRRLVCYTHAAKHHRMVGWVGDPIDKVGLTRTPTSLAAPLQNDPRQDTTYKSGVLRPGFR